MIVDDLIEICHGTPFDEDAYVFDDLDALRAMHAARRPLCLFGHTHVQVGHYLSRDQFGLSTADDQRPLMIPLDEANRYLVNPGSVGQPRDGDPRAGFRPGRHRGARDDDLSHRVSDCEGAGAHHGRGLTRRPRATTGARTVADLRFADFRLSDFFVRASRRFSSAA